MPADPSPIPPLRPSALALADWIERRATSHGLPRVHQAQLHQLLMSLLDTYLAGLRSEVWTREISEWYEALCAALGIDPVQTQWLYLNTAPQGARVQPPIFSERLDTSRGVEELVAALRLLDDADTSSAPSSSVANVALTQFLDFPTKERALLTALQGKDYVPITEILRVVWDNQLPKEPKDTLHKLVTRTNKRLTEKNRGLEIKKEAETYKLTTI
jgi:hypothetical protein